jgi:hypothetical protein
VVESAPLLREYTLIAYRGFESLSLRQTQKTGPAIAGLFFGSGGERGLKRTLRFDKLRSSLDRLRRPRRGSKREMQSRFESIPLPASSIYTNASRGFFLGSGGERGLKRTLRFDKLRSSLDRKMLRNAGSLHFRHTAHPCALPRQAPPQYPQGIKGVKREMRQAIALGRRIAALPAFGTSMCLIAL